MEIVEVSLVNVAFDDAKRQRKELEANDATITELMASMKSVGQIQPIVISRDGRLLAGRRRIEAAVRLGWQTIKAIIWEDLDLLEQKTLEYDENSKRKQLTWQESAAAIKEIHDLKIAKEGRQWSRSDTARALGLSIGKVSEDLDLAVALSNPRVARWPTRRGAIGTVKRERELVLVRELARRRAHDVGIEVDVPSETFAAGVVYNGDCREILARLAEASVDMVVTDPPWGIDLATSSQWTHKWIATYDDRPESVRELLAGSFKQIGRVLKPLCHLFTFFPAQEIAYWVDLLNNSGISARQRPLIWYKSGQQGISDVYTSFLPAYESILWGFKTGEAHYRLFNRPLPEAQAHPREDTIWHENSKPVEMLKSWIEACTAPNEIVLDPFCGGGSTLVAATESGRYYIGVEQDPVNYAKCVERLHKLEENKLEQDSDEDEEISNG